MLGDLIEQYDEINSAEEFSDIDDLQGINSNKYFQECKSNKNDIDLFRYRICRHGMFSYNKATSRNGEKISIALRTGKDCLVSPSYYCFSIKDENILSPKYLDIWFRRPIFDKYARFNSWGSATEFFTFDDFCATEIMLPTLDEQLRIVHEYQVITDRIALLNRLNEKLLCLAHTLYCQYVDAEDKTDWHMGTVSELLTVKYGKDHSLLSDGDVPLYGSGGLMRYVERPLYNKVSVLIPRKGTLNNIMYVDDPFWSVDTMFYTEIKNDKMAKYIYFFLKGIDFNGLNTGSAVPSTSSEVINSLQLWIPDNRSIAEFDNTLTPIFARIKVNKTECRKLENLRNLITLSMS